MHHGACVQVFLNHCERYLSSAQDHHAIKVRVLASQRVGNLLISRSYGSKYHLKMRWPLYLYLLFYLIIIELMQLAKDMCYVFEEEINLYVFVSVLSDELVLWGT